MRVALGKVRVHSVEFQVDDRVVHIEVPYESGPVVVRNDECLCGNLENLDQGQS